MSHREIVRQARVKREMSRLSVLVRVLSVIVLTLIVRALVDGVTVGIGVGAALAAGLLIIATAVRRQGRRLEIALSTSTETPDRAL